MQPTRMGPNKHVPLGPVYPPSSPPNASTRHPAWGGNLQPVSHPDAAPQSAASPFPHRQSPTCLQPDLPAGTNPLPPVPPLPEAYFRQTGSTLLPIAGKAEPPDCPPAHPPLPHLGSELPLDLSNTNSHPIPPMPAPHPLAPKPASPVQIPPLPGQPTPGLPADVPQAETPLPVPSPWLQLSQTVSNLTSLLAGDAELSVAILLCCSDTTPQQHERRMCDIASHHKQLYSAAENRLLHPLKLARQQLHRKGGCPPPCPHQGVPQGPVHSQQLTCTGSWRHPKVFGRVSAKEERIRLDG